MKKPVLKFFFLVFGTVITYAQSFQAGNTYLGAQGYIEYRAGNLPIIITAPHGGRLEPASIPNRNCAACVTDIDLNTMELGYQIDTALRRVFGCFPNIITNKLHRKKLDANREIVEAATGSLEAEQAWQEWHQFINTAKTEIVKRYGRGILIDLHGHGHTIQRLELGYLLNGSDLRLSDSMISTPLYLNRTSIKNLIANNLNGFNAGQLIRGTFALGTLLAAQNVPTVPSQQDRAPNVGEDYFNGGYNTLRHGSRDSTSIDAIQIECNWTGVRNTYENRHRFATELANALKLYLEKHYFNPLNFGCTTATADLNVLNSIVFPNPVRNSVNIAFDKPLERPLLMKLYNLQGQLIIEKIIETHNRQTRLDASNPLSSGVYLLNFYDENGGILKQTKVVIE
jgi:N-formylglutamate amidohydrolase